MRTLWTGRDIAAPASTLWDLLTDLDAWARWGPSVRSATLVGSGTLRSGARGTVTTALGVSLPFEVTAWDPPWRWAWRVAGIGATDHVVSEVHAGSCNVRFGVPFVAAPYLAVCRVALGRLESMALES
ncbi:MAG: SRPBCC family protein [Acidimicrobiales bacterium]